MGNSRRFPKILSGLLALIMLAGAAGCTGSEQNSQSAKISVASSDAEKYAEWLDERLTEIPDEVVLGVGGSNAYGVDMSNFEDDGYIIKRSGGEVVIFGKTGDGLDRGVRKYAKAVKAGNPVEETVYHEGYRIERLTLFGTDISEFAIVYPEENNANMVFAAEELQRLIKKACGADLSIEVGNMDAARRIELRHTEDAALKENGYRYFEENGNLVIEGAVARGCLNGVYRFLQNECGWEGLTYGDSMLLENEHLQIQAGISKTGISAYNYLDPYTELYNKFNSDKGKPTEAQLSYGPITVAMHGMQHNMWAGQDVTHYQICYTNEENLQECFNNISWYIEKQIEAGKTVGVDLNSIDISQGDNFEYCECERCCEVFAVEKAHSGAVVRFANKLADMLNEVYPGINLLIFAYAGTCEPPAVAKPNEHVYVTYAMNGNCSNHVFTGEDCDGKILFGLNNKDYCSYFDGWAAITEHLYVWYYALPTHLNTYTIFDIFLEDFKYFSKNGAEGLFIESEYCGFGFQRILHQLAYEMNWNIDMTDEEYEELLCEIMRKEYGDGWTGIREYETILSKAQDAVSCFDCWAYTTLQAQPNQHSSVFLSENSDNTVRLLNYAVENADTERQEMNCRMIEAGMLFHVCETSYFDAYNAYDEEKLALLDSYYQEIIDNIEYAGLDPKKIWNINTLTLPDTLDELMWIHNIGVREALTKPGTVERPAPVEYAVTN